VERAIVRDVKALVTVGYCSPSLPGNTILSPALLLAIQMYWQGIPILARQEYGLFAVGLVTELFMEQELVSPRLSSSNFHLL
jgi:hypothetical protein